MICIHSILRACTALKFEFYIPHTDTLIVWRFCKSWTTGADLRGDLIKPPFFKALKGRMYMADNHIALISVLIILYYACIIFQKFGMARWNA